MKSIKRLFLLPILLLAVSCNGNNDSSIAKNSKWGIELGTILEKNLGIDLPYISCDSFTYDDKIDDYGDPLTVIYCYFESEEALDNSPNVYASLCEKDGYDVTLETIGSTIDGVTYVYDCYFADKIISDTKGIELQFLLGADNLGRDCLGIFAFTYKNYDKNVWPATLISEYLDGATIPSVDGEGYTYNYWSLIDNSGNEYLEIVVYGTSFEDEGKYCATLAKNGYVVDNSNYDEYGYLAMSSDGKIGLSFYYDYNYYNGIVIYIYNLTLESE